MLSGEQGGLVAADRRLRRERIHCLSARDARHGLHRERDDPELCESFDPRTVAERIEEADQQLTLAQPGRLGFVRLAHLDDGVGVPRRAERRAGFGVGVVGERGGLARTGLDDHVEARRRKLSDRLGHERDPALARRRLTSCSDPHRGRLYATRPTLHRGDELHHATRFAAAVRGGDARVLRNSAAG